MSVNKSRKRKSRSYYKNPEETAQDKLIEISNFALEDDPNDAFHILLATPSYVEPVVPASLPTKRPHFVTRRSPSKRV